MSAASTLLLGLLLGLRHATDPDHVVAMGTIVTRDPRLRRAVGNGVFWGLGHTVTVLVVGVLILVCGVRVPERAVTLMDLAVAAMLIALGVVALGSPRSPVATTPALGERILVSPLRPLVVGIVHGLAGSAAMTLLALATLRDARGALLYLGLFGAGTVLGMVAITTLLALSLRWVGAKSASVSTWIARVSGSVSIAAGLVLTGRTLLP
jgi:high-affinity nickel-transport protein